MAKAATIPQHAVAIRMRKDDLVVEWTPDRSTARHVVDLRDWPGDRRLRTELADSLEALTGAVGTWRSVPTVASSANLLRRFTEFCAANDVSQLRELNRATWNDFQLQVQATGGKNTHRKNLGVIRLAISRFPQRLQPELRDSLMRRLPRAEPEAVVAYHPVDFDKITRAARREVQAAWRRIAASQEVLAAAAGPVPEAEQSERILALREIAATGRPEPRKSRYRALGLPSVRAGVNAARRHLFLDGSEAVAAAVLIACTEGLNFTPIAERTVPSAAPGLGVPDELMSVEDEKRRRGRQPFDAHAIPARARTPIAMIKQMTQPGRDYLLAHGLEGSERLINYWRFQGRGALAPQANVPRPAEVKLAWWPEDVPPLQFGRLRKSWVVHIERTPQGHSRATWIKSYLLADEVERERLRTESVEAGLWSLINSAEAHLRMRFEHVSLERDNDTAFASCTDFEHHPRTGMPCGDDFLLCLQCENAVATPRHLPQLVALQQALEGLASTDGPAWTDFRAAAYGCLMALLNDRSLISEEELAAARHAVTDADRHIIDRTLNGVFQ